MGFDFSLGVRHILRRDIDKLGYDRNFTIYDTADSELMKSIISDRISTRRSFPKSVLSYINFAKTGYQAPRI